MASGWQQELSLVTHNYLGWTEHQWTKAFDWYARVNETDAPERDSRGCGIVRAEWQRRMGVRMP